MKKIFITIAALIFALNLSCDNIFKEDNDKSVNITGPEICDGIDNDGDGITDGLECITEDYDGDGYTNEAAYGCNDYDSAYHPGAYEPCCPTGVTIAICDKNCDGEVTSCAVCDTDFDEYCSPEDCAPNDPSIYPGAPEKCNDGIDQDCSNSDLLCAAGTDTDGDNYIPPADCDNNDPDIHPGAEELCDNKDNNCDGVVDEGNPGGGSACGVSGTLVCVHDTAQNIAGLVCVESEK